MGIMLLRWVLHCIMPHYFFAENTITGSIGVFVFTQFCFTTKIGINVEQVNTHENAAPTVHLFH
jgi:hypothetical protein